MSVTTTSALAATAYVVTPLQALEAGSADNQLAAISATGTTAGVSWTLDSYKLSTWENTGAVRELFPGSQEESLPYDINASNQVLLFGPRIRDNGVVTPVYVGSVGGYPDGALSLNDSGQVASTGHFPVGTGNQRHALLVTNGATVDLGVLPGTTTSWANELNNNGDVVGYSYASIAVSRATLWRNGDIIGLGPLPGPTASTADDINDNGRVVGTSGGRLYTWENGVMTDLGATSPDATMTAHEWQRKLPQAPVESGLYRQRERQRPPQCIWCDIDRHLAQQHALCLCVPQPGKLQRDNDHHLQLGLDGQRCNRQREDRGSGPLRRHQHQHQHQHQHGEGGVERSR